MDRSLEVLFIADGPEVRNLRKIPLRADLRGAESSGTDGALGIDAGLPVITGIDVPTRGSDVGTAVDALSSEDGSVFCLDNLEEDVGEKVNGFGFVVETVSAPLVLVAD